MAISGHLKNNVTNPENAMHSGNASILFADLIVKLPSFLLVKQLLKITYEIVVLSSCKSVESSKSYLLAKKLLVGLVSCSTTRTEVAGC